MKWDGRLCLPALLLTPAPRHQTSTLRGVARRIAGQVHAVREAALALHVAAERQLRGVLGTAVIDTELDGEHLGPRSAALRLLLDEAKHFDGGRCSLLYSCSSGPFFCAASASRGEALVATPSGVGRTGVPTSPILTTCMAALACVH
jgi:hypothetical protein